MIWPNGFGKSKTFVGGPPVNGMIATRRFKVSGWLGHKITAYPHAPEKHQLVRIALASLRAG